MDALTEAQLRAAFDVLQSIGAGPRSYVAIVGGLVPTLRAGDCDVPPQAGPAGTRDVDLAVRLALNSGTTAAYYKGLTEALRDCGLTPEGEQREGKPKWRWVGAREGAKLTVELLSEPSHSGRPGRAETFHNVGERDGDDEFDVLAVLHSDLVFLDRQVVEIPLDLPEGRRPRAPFPIAGLGSWLVLKRLAADNRGAEPTHDGRPMGKDFFDIAWLLLCLGPEGVGLELSKSPLLANDDAASVLREALQWIHEQFVDRGNYAPGRYFAFLQADGHDVDETTARLDASKAVSGGIVASGLLQDH